LLWFHVYPGIHFIQIYIQRVSVSPFRRDKSRGYAWNKDKEAGANSNTASNAAAVELPDSVKRKLWSALTVLSHALPGCEPVSVAVFVLVFEILLSPKPYTH